MYDSKHLVQLNSERADSHLTLSLGSCFLAVTEGSYSITIKKPKASSINFTLGECETKYGK